MITPLQIRANAYVDRVLSDFPGEGAGLHQWLYSTAATIWFAFSDAARLKDVIHDAIAPHLSETRKHAIRREIREAIRNTQAIASPPDWYREAIDGVDSIEPTVSTTAPDSDLGPRWPRKDYASIFRIVSERLYPLVEVEKHSPRAITDDRLTEEIIDALFPGNPLLCIASAENRHKTAPRETWRGRLQSLPFIVPNAMKKPWGKTQEGKASMRTKSNVGPRHYLVVEFDFARLGKNGRPTFDIDLLDRLEAKGITIPDLCASVIAELQFAGRPVLRLVLSSGGKSLHSWWDCQGISDEETEIFFSKACSLGADPATWTLCQLVRIPDGTRDNGTRQKVHFFSNV